MITAVIARVIAIRGHRTPRSKVAKADTDDDGDAGPPDAVDFMGIFRPLPGPRHGPVQQPPRPAQQVLQDNADNADTLAADLEQVMDFDDDLDLFGHIEECKDLRDLMLENEGLDQEEAAEVNALEEAEANAVEAPAVDAAAEAQAFNPAETPAANAAEDLAAVPANEPAAHEAIDVSGVLAELGLEDKGVGKVWRLADATSGQPVGMIHHLTSGQTPSLKATCEKHRSCVCWVSKVGDRRLEVLDALIRWLKSGQELGGTEHENAAVEVKRGFGMRVRGRAV